LSQSRVASPASAEPEPDSGPGSQAGRSKPGRRKGEEASERRQQQEAKHSTLALGTLDKYVRKVHDNKTHNRRKEVRICKGRNGGKEPDIREERKQRDKQHPPRFPDPLTV
jgi:hypothetical protein